MTRGCERIAAPKSWGDKMTNPLLLLSLLTLVSVLGFFLGYAVRSYVSHLRRQEFLLGDPAPRDATRGTVLSRTEGRLGQLLHD